MKFRKVMAVILAAALTFSMAACGDKTQGDATPTQGASSGGEQAGTTNPGTNTPSTGGTNTEIIIGTWWKQYYDSSATELESDPSYSSNYDAPEDNEE